MTQFTIDVLYTFPDFFGFQLEFTNSAFYMLLSLLSISFLLFGFRTKQNVDDVESHIPTKWQVISEMSYDFIAKMVTSVAGSEGMKHYTLVFSLFLFILFGNLLGMLPYGFTLTSHISVTVVLALIVFLYVNFIAFSTHGIKYFKMFLPAGTPWWLAPLMVFIEVFAYLARPFSLAVRLAANMMAGHTMLKIIASFVLAMNFLLACFPFTFTVVLMGFEVFVAVLQAYIFAVLTCVYLNDALHMH